MRWVSESRRTVSLLDLSWMWRSVPRFASCCSQYWKYLLSEGAHNYWGKPVGYVCMRNGRPTSFTIWNWYNRIAVFSIDWCISQLMGKLYSYKASKFGTSTRSVQHRLLSRDLFQWRSIVTASKTRYQAQRQTNNSRARLVLNIFRAIL